jgi:hypothetical protein
MTMHNSLLLPKGKSFCRGAFLIFDLCLLIAFFQVISCAISPSKPTNHEMTTPGTSPVIEEHGDRAKIDERGLEKGTQATAGKEIGSTTVIEENGQQAVAEEPLRIEERWGVKILGIRLTANAYLLDFRFHVIDAKKAHPLIDRHTEPYLVDETSGMMLSVPNMPQVGSLRAKGNEPDRDYFILFSNSKGLVKRGNKVTVIADDFRAEHLTVQ